MDGMGNENGKWEQETGKEFVQEAAWLRIHGYLLHKYNQE